jgi:hypothetical protein
VVVPKVNKYAGESEQEALEYFSSWMSWQMSW